MASAIYCNTYGWPNIPLNQPNIPQKKMETGQSQPSHAVKKYNALEQCLHYVASQLPWK